MTAALLDEIRDLIATRGLAPQTARIDDDAPLGRGGLGLDSVAVVELLVAARSGSASTCLIRCSRRS